MLIHASWCCAFCSVYVCVCDCVVTPVWLSGLWHVRIRVLYELVNQKYVTSRRYVENLRCEISQGIRIWWGFLVWISLPPFPDLPLWPLNHKELLHLLVEPRI